MPKRRLRRKGRAAPIAVLSVILVACDAELAPPTSGPDKQFSARQVRIEERNGERVLWSGRAARAGGDLESTEVFDVELERHADGKEPRLVVKAPRGVLALGNGRADFETAEVFGDDGSHLTAGAVHYNEADKTLVLDGPLALTSDALHVRGAHAVLTLSDQSLVITGPITGRITPGKR